jgi:class I fructose-bisphosphate aldolase
MRNSERVKQILSWYKNDNLAVQKNLCTLLNTGDLSGTGKMVILPIDQGFEHGPARSFASTPERYDPRNHFELAIESGCSAYAAPFGQLAASVGDYVGEMPVIVKVNNSDSLFNAKNAVSAVTCSVKDALRIGATAIGFTIYPGSSYKKEMYEEIREMGEEARSYGLPVVIWSYPRGEGISKEGETAIDVVAYAAHIAAQLGAHIIKVKPPTAHIELPAARKVYVENEIPVSTLTERVRHVIESVFGGRRIVIFSGGEAKDDATLMSEVRELAKGRAFGSIMGRNAFQRPGDAGVDILKQVIAEFKRV